MHVAMNVVRDSEVPLTSQIQRFIKSEVAAGVLHPGSRLPSSRSLADDLGVSRSVVVEAYGQLVAEGYLEAVQGAGTRVVRHLRPEPVVPTLLDDGRVPDVRWDLRPGAPAFPHFPRRDWLTSYQRALQGADPADHDYPPPAGVPTLRVELAHYLGRVCGVPSTPDEIMVVAGFAQTLGLLGAALPALGVDALGMENPGHPRQRRFVRECGLRPVPLPVDAEGIDVAALRASGARAVLVTPAHQYPTGVTLSARRRAALVAWAQETGGWIVEDDYDGGLWYERGTPRPLALRRLAPDHVVYAGTASKTLAPGLRLGWLAAPRALLDPLLRARARHDLGTDSLAQLAFAQFLRSGLYDRHLRRLNSLCRDRRQVLETAVRRHLPGAAVLGPAAGVHAYVRLPPHTDEAALVAAALRRSVLVRGAAGFHARAGEGPPALVVGHAQLPRTGIGDAIAELGTVLG
ncbi:PLP-dependent aminotransferase family protein [Streptomyces sp. NPDC102406]|uniref:MocR-like pyridoxine biosynthesis transcription factor PdxR n=1 Tax=Streptomyces sp. NPDC102406 TaxID=3366171 RepID=UPI003829DEF4